MSHIAALNQPHQERHYLRMRVRVLKNFAFTLATGGRAGAGGRHDRGLSECLEDELFDRF